VISGHDLEQDKPHASPFQTALDRMNLKPFDAIILENSPLGVEAANKAGIQCIIRLNNTPLDIPDFKCIMFVDSDINNNNNSRVFKDTKSASNFLKEWYCRKVIDELYV
jgi:beta-phosphoglucomutase